MIIRPRRNRKSEAIRSLVRENTLDPSDFINPMFIIDGSKTKTEIASMPGIFRMTPDLALEECRQLLDLGVQAVALFPALEDSKKDRMATESHNPLGFYQKTIALIKKELPGMVVISDVAMDPYSSDGHDGIVSPEGEILNDSTLVVLGKMAVSQAQAGADIVAPSDMMDGRVGYIRDQLDLAGFENTSILSYSAKYASYFYGPFRDALSSAPKMGDKKTYQMDFSNAREALREVELDIEEGADMVMVKPGLPYLDVLRAVAEISPVPVAVYNVSGEYAMHRAAAEKGWIKYEGAVLETLTAFKRAGADMILTYHAKEAAGWLRR